MKKTAAILLAILTAMVLTACGEAKESPEADGARPARTEAEAAENDRPARTEPSADVNVPITSEDFVKEHGIALDTYYFPFANPNWGRIEFLSDGTFTLDIPDIQSVKSTWSADVNGVYVANDEGEEHQIGIYNDGDIVEIASIIGQVSGKDPVTTYTGIFKYDGDHEWLDILEFYEGFDAGYKSNDEFGDVTEQGSATYLAYDNKVIVTQNLFDGTNKPAMLYTNDGGETFEDDYDTYYPYKSEESGGSDMDYIAEYAASLGDRSEYRNAAEELGIEIDGIYYSDLDNGSYLFISEDGLLYFYEPDLGQTIPFTFDIDTDTITVYYYDGSYVTELIFSGNSFYETDTGAFYEPY